MSEMKPIQDHPDYFVDACGNVYSRVFWRKHRGSTMNDPPLRKLHPYLCMTGHGYYMVILLNGHGERKRRYVHDLVLEAFVGPKPKGQCACHGPSGSLVNTLDNLRWGTRKDNTNDMLRDNTMSMGERHPSAKLTLEQMNRIRRLHNSKRRHKMTNADIAAPFGMCPQNVSAIGLRKSWKHF